MKRRPSPMMAIETLIMCVDKNVSANNHEYALNFDVCRRRPNREATADLRGKPPPPMDSAVVVWSSDYVLCLLVA